LRQANCGTHLLSANGSQTQYYGWNDQSATAQGLSVVPLWHLFGSEELSARSPAIQARATGAYVALSAADAEKLGLAPGDGVRVQGNGSVPYMIRESLQPGSVGVSVGLPGLNFWDLDGSVAIEKADNWQRPVNFRDDNI